MKIHEITREQRLNTTLDEAWSFFSKPANLNDITPADLRFQIVGDPGTMYPGQIIEYRIAILGLPRTWLTEIKQVEVGRYFIDEQRIGPYKFWHHHHSFTVEGDHVLMHDQVRYALPFGPLGALAHKLFVEHMLERIFAYRHKIIEQKFSAGPPPPSVKPQPLQ